MRLELLGSVNKQRKSRKKESNSNKKRQRSQQRSQRNNVKLSHRLCLRLLKKRKKKQMSQLNSIAAGIISLSTLPKSLSTFSLYPSVSPLQPPSARFVSKLVPGSSKRQPSNQPCPFNRPVLMSPEILSSSIPKSNRLPITYRLHYLRKNKNKVGRYSLGCKFEHTDSRLRIRLAVTKGMKPPESFLPLYIKENFKMPTLPQIFVINNPVPNGNILVCLTPAHLE